MKDKKLFAIPVLIGATLANNVCAITATGADCEYGVGESGLQPYSECSGPNRSGFASIPLGEVGVSTYGTDYGDGTSDWGTVDAAMRTGISITDFMGGDTITSTYEMHVSGSFTGVAGSELEARMQFESSIDEVSLRQNLVYDGTSVIFETPTPISGTTGPLGRYSINVISADPSSIYFVITGLVDVSDQNNNVGLLLGLNAISSATAVGTTAASFSDTARLEIIGVSFESETGELFADRAVVPIPPAIWLFGSGLLGLVGIARRKKAEPLLAC